MLVFSTNTQRIIRAELEGLLRNPRYGVYVILGPAFGGVRMTLCQHALKLRPYIEELIGTEGSG